MDLSALYAHDQYVIRKQVFKLLGGAFHVYGPGGELVMYSRLKAFKLREDIRLYTGEDMTVELLTINARQIIDFSAAYDVTDAQSRQKVGALRRKGFKSMVKDEWQLLDPMDREIGLIREDGMLLALLRRFVDMASLVAPQHFHAEVGGAPVCTYQQNYNPFVRKLTVDFTPDAARQFDRRLGIAAGILLLAIEGRQQ